MQEWQWVEKILIEFMPFSFAKSRSFSLIALISVFVIPMQSIVAKTAVPLPLLSETATVLTFISS